jgi:hypothetical protein
VSSTVPTIAVVNESTVITTADVAATVSALQTQAAYHVKPVWGQGAHIVTATSVPANAWGVVILDNSDQAGALGYHDLTAAGLPLGKIFAKTDLDNGYDWHVTVSHEVVEMLVDPWIDAAAQVGSKTFYALEACDACEADKYGYQVKGVTLSDFVHPAWFRQGAAGPYDHAGHVSAPLELLSGGYIGAWTPTSGWTQKTARTGKAPESRRIPLRQRKHAGGELKRSIR